MNKEIWSPVEKATTCLQELGRLEEGAAELVEKEGWVFGGGGNGMCKGTGVCRAGHT